MQSAVKPVAIGFILGLLGLMFGIFWAVYIVVGHEGIHKTLSESGKAAMESKVIVSPPSPEAARDHGGSNGHSHDMPKVIVKKEVKDEHAHGYASEHEDPLMEAAHERLTKGHAHAMGLGILTIAVSFVLAFSSASNFVKTFASACLGVGGIFYPFSWIIMGYRTPAMGIAASADSVLPVVAFSMPLVLLGLFITVVYVIKGRLTRG